MDTINFTVPRLPGDTLPIGLGEAHFWLSALDIPGEVIAQIKPFLSPEERMRAERFRSSRDQERYIVSRGRLRILLGAYNGVAPSGIVFAYGIHGKPNLCPKSPPSDLQFNVAHSGSMALYGITRGLNIGVDIERISDEFPWRDFARRFFASVEYDALNSLPPHLQQSAFYTCWTRKESFVKATGEGLRRSLKTFEVSVLPGESRPVLRENGSNVPSSEWRLLNLIAEHGYAAAATIETGIHPALCQGWLWDNTNFQR